MIRKIIKKITKKCSHSESKKNQCGGKAFCFQSWSEIISALQRFSGDIWLRIGVESALVIAECLWNFNQGLCLTAYSSFYLWERSLFVLDYVHLTILVASQPYDPSAKWAELSELLVSKISEIDLSKARKGYLNQTTLQIHKFPPRKSFFETYKKAIIAIGVGFLMAVTVVVLILATLVSLFYKRQNNFRINTSVTSAVIQATSTMWMKDISPFLDRRFDRNFEFWKWIVMMACLIV